MDMSPQQRQATAIDDDVKTLQRMGYQQELARVLNGFSNFAISLSIICILAGGLTSFHAGYGSVGGASIGIGWPLACLVSLAVAMTMAQIASAFPTAGGLYHWAAILGGRGCGWTTAWFNLAGLITVLAAINVGTYRFAMSALWPEEAESLTRQIIVVAAITFSQAFINHLGIRITRILTDLSGYWILLISLALIIALLSASTWDFSRLITFTNFSGLPADNPTWPKTDSLIWLFALGLILPAYTITGFDASAHVSEETVGAAHQVPKGIINSVLVSSIVGWVILCAIVLAMKDPNEAAQAGEKMFVETLSYALQYKWSRALCICITIAQYLCGLATVTSASRMMFAFARDGGTPFSPALRSISPRFQTPACAIWVVAFVAVLFTVNTPVYTTITTVCAIFLYISYVIPTLLGFFTLGRSWQALGPWRLGAWFRPLALISVLGSLGLIVIGIQPPNEDAAYVLLGVVVFLALYWFAFARRHFPGPPVGHHQKH